MFCVRYKCLVGLLFLTLLMGAVFYARLLWNVRPTYNKYITKSMRLRIQKQEIFLRRENRITKTCQLDPVYSPISAEDHYENLAKNPQLLRNILVNDKYKILYCYVPKVACTNWKKVLFLLGSTNTTNLSQIPSDSVHRKDVFQKLSDLQGDDITRRLKTYHKFLFVRHPIERVISAYRNKFVMNYTSSAYFKKRFGVSILKRFRQRDSISPTGDGVRFSEFIQYMIQTFDQAPQFLNEHWAPQSQLCHPCSVRYNLIGKYESLKRDAEFILEEIEVPNWVRFPKGVPSKTPMYVDSYMSTLTLSQRDGLLKVYDEDFKLFDYHYRRKE